MKAALPAPDHTGPEDRNRENLRAWLGKRAAGVALEDLRTRGQLLAWRTLQVALARVGHALWARNLARYRADRARFAARRLSQFKGTAT